MTKAIVFARFRIMSLMEEKSLKKAFAKTGKNPNREEIALLKLKAKISPEIYESVKDTVNRFGNLLKQLAK